MNTEGFKKAEKFNINQSVSYADGGIVSKIINKNSAGNITLFSFDKGQSLSEHTAPFDAIIQILEGEALISICQVSTKPNIHCLLANQL